MFWREQFKKYVLEDKHVFYMSSELVSIPLPLLLTSNDYVELLTSLTSLTYVPSNHIV